MANHNVNGEFQLTTKHYYAIMGHKDLTEFIKREYKRLGIAGKNLELMNFRKKATDVEKYNEYAEACLTQYKFRLKHVLNRTSIRKFKFTCSQKQQRSIHHIAKMLTFGIENPQENCLIIWGNGSFGPCYKGHRAAPNKRLRYLLRVQCGLNIVLSDERNTSKLTCCCQKKYKSIKAKGDRRRDDVVKCGECGKIIGRDSNGAINILKVALDGPIEEATTNDE